MIVLPAKETLHGKMNLIQTIGKLFFSFNSELILVKEYTGVPIEITHSPPPHPCPMIVEVEGTKLLSFMPA